MLRQWTDAERTAHVRLRALFETEDCGVYREPQEKLKKSAGKNSLCYKDRVLAIIH